MLTLFLPDTREASHFISGAGDQKQTSHSALISARLSKLLLDFASALSLTKPRQFLVLACNSAVNTSGKSTALMHSVGSHFGSIVDEQVDCWQGRHQTC
jgi:hypothetical protein